MKAVFLETSAKDNQNANDIFMKSILEIEKVDTVNMFSIKTGTD